MWIVNSFPSLFEIYLMQYNRLGIILPGDIDGPGPASSLA